MVLKVSTVTYFNLKFYWSVCKKMLWLDDLLPSALVQVIAQSVIATLLKKLYNNLNFLNTNIICHLVSNTNIKTVKLCTINLKSKTSTCFVAQNQMDYLLKKRRNWKSSVVRDHMHVCYLHHLIYCMPHWPVRKKNIVTPSTDLNTSQNFSRNISLKSQNFQSLPPLGIR